MKKMICTTLGAAIAALGSVAAQPEVDEKAWSKEFREKAVAFVKTLDAGQQKVVMLPFDHEERWEIRFPGGERPGLLIGKLAEEQKKALFAAGGMVLSETGVALAEAITAQGPGGGLDRLWVTVFGDPREGDFALRVAEHHFTVVNVEVKEGLPSEVGPLLLGSNPPHFFEEEEDALLAIWKVLDEQERKKIKKKGKGASGTAIGENDGVAFADLSEEARETVMKAGRLRGALFSEAIRARILRRAEELGGDENLRVAFYFTDEEPAKRCKDGGRWDFKFGIPGSLLWDYQSSGGHIHTSVWVK